MIDIGLISARLVHYGATTALFGVSLFPLYAYLHDEAEELGHWRRRLLLPIAVLAVLSGLFWFAFSAANMAGRLSDLADVEVLWSVVRDTGFGVVWTARMVLAVIYVFAAAVRSSPRKTFRQDLVKSILAAALLASLAGTGHAQANEGWASAVHVLSDAVHLLAAGAWLGGLVPLAYILASHPKENPDAAPIDQVLLRFSRMGYVAVTTLVGTGFVNGWFLVGSVSNLLSTPYGQVLAVKLGLFAGMVALAAANRFWLVPAMSSARHVRSELSMAWLRRLRNHVFGEQFLGAMVLLAVSLFGTMRPAIGQ